MDEATDPVNKRLRLFIDGQSTGTLANGNALWINPLLFPALRCGHRLFQRPSHQKQIPSSPPPARGWGKTEMKLHTEEQFQQSQPDFAHGAAFA